MSKKAKPSLFSKSELVYAKIRGYPWWPGKIGQVKHKINEENEELEYEYIVNFIGDNSHSIVSEDKLRKFTIQEIDLKDKKRKKLMQSMQIANEIFEGKYTYKAWRKQKEQQNKQRRKKAQLKKGKIVAEESSESDDTSSSSSSSSDDDQSSEIEQEEENNIKLARALSLNDRISTPNSQSQSAGDESVQAKKKKKPTAITQAKQGINMHEEKENEEEEEEEEENLQLQKKNSKQKSQRSTVIDDSEEEKRKQPISNLRKLSSERQNSDMPELKTPAIQKNDNPATNITQSCPLITPQQTVSFFPLNSQKHSQELKTVIETEDDEEEIEVLASNSSEKHMMSSQEETKLSKSGLNLEILNTILKSADQKGASTEQQSNRKTSINNGEQQSPTQINCQYREIKPISQTQISSVNIVPTISTLAKQTKSTEKKLPKPALSKKSASWMSQIPSLSSEEQQLSKAQFEDISQKTAEKQKIILNQRTRHSMAVAAANTSVFVAPTVGTRVRFEDEVKKQDSDKGNLSPKGTTSTSRVTRRNKLIKPIKRTRGTKRVEQEELEAEEEEEEEIVTEEKEEKTPRKSLTKRKKGISKKQSSQKKLKNRTLQIARESKIRSNRSLEMEFTSLFSLLQNCHKTDVLSESLSVIGEIIRRIGSWNPNNENILEILQLDSGKLLMCIMQMCFSSKDLPYYKLAMASLHRDRYLSVRTELQKLLNSLSSALFKRFFDHEEKIKILQAFNNPLADESSIFALSSTSNSQSNSMNAFSAINLFSILEDKIVSTSDLSEKLADEHEMTIEKSESNPTNSQTNQPTNQCEQENKDLTEEQKNMRKKICLKIMKPLKDIVKDQQKLQHYAKLIEGIVRKADPTMSAEYKSISINLITHISKEGFSTTCNQIEEYIASENAKDFSILSRISCSSNLQENSVRRTEEIPNDPSQNTRLLLLRQKPEALSKYSHSEEIHSFNTTSKLSSPSGSAHIKAEDDDDEEEDQEIIEQQRRTEFTSSQIQEPGTPTIHRSAMEVEEDEEDDLLHQEHAESAGSGTSSTAADHKPISFADNTKQDQQTLPQQQQIIVKSEPIDDTSATTFLMPNSNNLHSASTLQFSQQNQ